MQGNQLTVHFPFHRIHIPVDLGKTDLPVVHNSFFTENKNHAIVPLMRSPLAYSIISNLDVFGYLSSIKYLQDVDISSDKMEIESEFKHHYPHFCGACVGDPVNQNLSGPQKELLIWHWELLFCIYRIQDCMKPCTFEEPSGNRTILLEIINPKFSAARNFGVPACESCMLERAKSRSTNTKKFKPLE